jgi:DNA-binding CsgD family transcriptional regulator
VFSLFYPDGEANVFCVNGWTQEEIALYVSRYAATDPWQIGTARWPEGSPATDRDICPREEAEVSLAYREFYEPKGAVHGASATILAGPGGQFKLSLTRSAESGPFGETELAILRLLLPHLKRAALLHGRLGSMQTQLAAFTGHLDRYPYPFLLTDLERRVLYANAAAYEFAASRNGMAIDSGRVTLLSAKRDREFQQIASDMNKRGEPDLQRFEISIGSGKRTHLLVMRAHDSSTLPVGTSQPSVGLLIVDAGSSPPPDPALLGELFLLTPSESRVAAKLACGKSVEEVARENDASVETVRTHLKRILSKTGTRRQGELVSLILRSTPFHV